MRAATQCGYGGTLLGLALYGIFGFTGCRPRSPDGPPSQPAPGRGSSLDAVLHDYRGRSADASRAGYRGDGWVLHIDPAHTWREVADPASTLHLVRQADDVELHLRLSAFSVRAGMAPQVFIEAYAMWRAEEGRPRVEARWDEGLAVWRGYALDESREVYFAFWVAGDRAYVLQESAASGVLKEVHVADFERTVADFECGPRPPPTASGSRP